MSELYKHAKDAVTGALTKNDLLLRGPEDGKRRGYDSDVYTPEDHLGFEIVSRKDLQDLSLPDLSAFEGSPRRFLRDKLVAATGLSGQLETVAGKTSEPFPLDHTLGHLRHPDLYLTVGPPFYDTSLLAHIAFTAAHGLEHAKDLTLADTKARQAQVTRWRQRFATSGEDWLGQLIRTTEDTSRMVQEGQSFSEKYPIDARTPIVLNYPRGDKGNELVVHNLHLLRDFDSTAVTDQVATDDQVRNNLANGLVLTRDVFTRPGIMPPLPTVTQSMEFYAAYLDRLRNLVGTHGTIEALHDQQSVFDNEYQKYATS